MTTEFRFKRVYLDSAQSASLKLQPWDRYLLDLTLLYGEFFCHVVSQAEVPGKFLLKFQFRCPIIWVTA